MNGMDGARPSARRNAWAKIQYLCPCGRTVYGNGKQHQRFCQKHLAEIGWPLDEGLRDALRAEKIDYRAVERRLGQQQINPSTMTWTYFRDLVWRLADEVKAST